jgi:DnaJ-class molecular chaperone
MITKLEKCNQCHGTGRIIQIDTGRFARHSYLPCFDCNETGKVRVKL